MQLSTCPKRLFAVLAGFICLGLATPILAAEPAWKSLFDGRTLKGWKATKFGGEGEVDVKDGQIVMHAGSPMTGITWVEDVPKIDYEITLEAMRVNGSDFFCGLTFPVGESPCSFIVGGWGGGVVGLSSIDGSDASENETTKYQEFTSGRWYPVRLESHEAENRSLDRQETDGQPRHQRSQAFDPYRSRAFAPLGHLLLQHHGRAARHQGSQVGRRKNSRRA